MKFRSFRKKRAQSRALVPLKIKLIKLNMKRSRPSTIDAKNQTENTEFMSSSIDAENTEFMPSSISFKKRDRKSKKIDPDVDAETDRETEIETDRER